MFKIKTTNNNMRYAYFPIDLLIDRHNIFICSASIWLYVYYVLKFGKDWLERQSFNIKGYPEFISSTTYYRARKKLEDKGFIKIEHLKSGNKISTPCSARETLKNIVSTSIWENNISISKQFMDDALPYFNEIKSLDSLKVYYYLKYKLGLVAGRSHLDKMTSKNPIILKEIAKHTNLDRNTVSKYLKILSSSSLLDCHNDGTITIYNEKYLKKKYLSNSKL